MVYRVANLVLENLIQDKKVQKVYTHVQCILQKPTSAINQKKWIVASLYTSCTKAVTQNEIKYIAKQLQFFHTLNTL